jgi:hypothetical protein
MEGTGPGARGRGSRGNGTWHPACREVPAMSEAARYPAGRKSPMGQVSPEALELGDSPRRGTAAGTASRRRLCDRGFAAAAGNMALRDFLEGLLGGTSWKG